MPSASSAHLRLVPATTEVARPHRWFCDSCGAPAPDALTPPPFSRACASCGLGQLVEASADVAPSPDDPFLVVDGALTVRSISASAAHLVAVAPHAVVGRPVAELLSAADAEAAGGSPLVEAIVQAAGGDEQTRRVTARPVDVFGVRLTLRVGVCGPPRGALLVVE